MDVALDLDDALWLSEGDKQLMLEFVQRSVRIIAKSRLQECRWYNLYCKRRQAALLAPFEPPKDRGD